VDAYPNQSFEGSITQIRLQPVVAQNVVTYTVMIDVSNPDLKLMPGMTANLTVTIQEAHDVLKVPLAALKFKPQWSGKHNGPQGRGNDTTRGSWGKGGPDGKRPPMVFMLDKGKPRPVKVKTVLSNSGFAAVEGELAAGDSVITGIQTDAANKPSASPQQNPLGGMPRRF
jgi:HlyD family secretion protein